MFHISPIRVFAFLIMLKIPAVHIHGGFVTVDGDRREHIKDRARELPVPSIKVIAVKTAQTLKKCRPNLPKRLDVFLLRAEQLFNPHVQRMSQIIQGLDIDCNVAMLIFGQRSSFIL